MQGPPIDLGRAHIPYYDQKMMGFWFPRQSLPHGDQGLAQNFPWDTMEMGQTGQTWL